MVHSQFPMSAGGAASSCITGQRIDLMELINRVPHPEPWSEGEKIPWDEPGFSRRMLREHLSQEHGLASRRFPKIEAHVAWIHQSLLGGSASQVLDLGCGPGLYTGRLAALGHDCLGIDFSPASIDYARQSSCERGGSDRYSLADIRTAPYGAGFDLAMLIFGEFNTFRTSEARRILSKANHALRPGGLLLLEPVTSDAVHEDGCRDPTWYSTSSGLFSDEPHVCLTEHVWDARQHVSTTRHYVLAADAHVTEYVSMSQAYTREELNALLGDCGFVEMATYASLMGVPDEDQPEFVALVARRPA